MTQSGEIYTFGPFRLEVGDAHARARGRVCPADGQGVRHPVRPGPAARQGGGKRGAGEARLARHVRVGRQPHAQRIGSPARARRRLGATRSTSPRFHVAGIGSPHRFTWRRRSCRDRAIVRERRRVPSRVARDGRARDAVAHSVTSSLGAWWPAALLDSSRGHARAGACDSRRRHRPAWRRA